MDKKAAIYHFTTSRNRRPKILQDKIASLQNFASSLGFTVTDLYCDKSVKKFERVEFSHFLLNSEQYDTLIVQDFHHICKNTMQCMKILKQLRTSGLSIYSYKDGSFVFEDIPLTKPLKIATYDCRFGSKSELHELKEVSKDILSLFAAKKTNWTVIDQYFDESFNQNKGEQKDLLNLINNKDKYDLILVHNLNDINWRTSTFCNIRRELQLDIYSIQDGFLAYRKDY